MYLQLHNYDHVQYVKYRFGVLYMHINSTHGIPSQCLLTIIQGSSAFVYGWVMFSDRLSNGVVVKIIQQATPSTSDRSIYTHVDIDAI